MSKDHHVYKACKLGQTCECSQVTKAFDTSRTRFIPNLQ